MNQRGSLEMQVASCWSALNTSHRRGDTHRVLTGDATILDLNYGKSLLAQGTKPLKGGRMFGKFGGSDVVPADDKVVLFCCQHLHYPP